MEGGTGAVPSGLDEPPPAAADLLAHSAAVATLGVGNVAVGVAHGALVPASGRGGARAEA